MNDLRVGDDVILTGQEIMTAVLVAAMRQIRCFKKHMNQTAGHSSDRDWQDSIEGALGEAAFAKISGLYWDYSVNTFRKYGDVDGLEIKTHWFTGSAASMIIRPKDSDDRKYIMMNGANGRYVYRGWVFGHEAKNKEWFRTAGKYDKRPPCYWVPLAALRREMF